MRRIALIPTLLTLGNGVSGFAAIAFASRIDGQPDNDIYFAVFALCLLISMLCDVLDGYVARLSKTASDFGGQLDSLCDAISFGAAPAYLILRIGRDWDQPMIRYTIAVIAALYMVCAILRLARFNVENTPDPSGHKRFKGLPSPAAAGCIVSLAILRSHIDNSWTGLPPDTIRTVVKVWAPGGTLLVALLMVSRVSYPHLTKQLLRGRRPFSYLVRLVLAVSVVALLRELSLLIIFWGYAVSFLLRHLVVRLQHDAEAAEANEEPRM